jgi:hypothetical protein
MTTYYLLPFEIVILISYVSYKTWYKLTIADPRVGRYSLGREAREAAQDRFTITIESTTFSQHTVQHILPNGMLHRNGELPAIIETDLYDDSVIKEWYQYDKRHRDNDKPAYVTQYTKMWYKHGKQHRGGIRYAMISSNYNPEIWHYGNKYVATEYKSYSELPLDVVLLIAEYSPTTWWCLVRADPQLGRYTDRNIPCSLQDKFTSRKVDYVTMSSGLCRRVSYCLPNGLPHRGNNLPAVVYENGLKKWYVNGLLHRYESPAVFHRGHIEKWYNCGKLNRFHNKPTIRILKGTITDYDNEHYK